jgi:hypothetical protein
MPAAARLSLRLAFQNSPLGASGAGAGVLLLLLLLPAAEGQGAGRGVYLSLFMTSSD